ncbi:PKD-like family lipoprotein [Bacteroides sp.]|uniref:PKD-like family lipoprotein n=1 Tax=Bacteroides sp. TaxID=29523 RepID=UPI0031FD3628
MRKYIICIVSFIGAALLQTGCYDDKGDYDYHDVNTMEIVIPETKLRMPKEEAVEVSIMPQISQTLEQNEENLVFQWKRLNPDATLGSDRLADYTNYSVGKECKITVEPNESNNIGLMLAVSDKRNGTMWYKQGQVTIIKPFNPCWFVLQEKENKGVLGAIEGTSEGYYVYSDVFQSETGTTFPLDGKPLAMTARREYGGDRASISMMPPFFGLKIVPILTLVTDKDAALFTPSTLEMMYQSDKILFEPIQQGKAIKIDAYKMDKNGELFVNDGKSYFAYMDGFCIPYSIQNEDGDYPSISAYGSYGTGLVFFDSSTHSFLNGRALSGYGDYYTVSYSISKSVRSGFYTWKDQHPIVAYTINPDDEEGSAFNPNSIDPFLQVRAIVTGGNGGNYAYAVTSSQNGKDLTVFKFSADWENEDPTCAGLYTVSLPSEIDVETAKFAASYAYTADLLFVVSGNKLYRIDLNRSLVTELYQYETDPSAQITCLKFKDAENEEELGMSLGLGINTAAKGVVVELQLTVAGDVAREENSICVYENSDQPIGKIVDISYNYE